MKILVVCQYYYPEPFRISDICEKLVEKGHEVSVLTGLPNYPEGEIYEKYKNKKNRIETINGVNVIRTFEKGRGNNKISLFLNYLSFTISGSLKALFLKGKFDVILVNQLSPILMGVPAIIYKKKNRKKILLYCLDLWPSSLAAGGVKNNSVVYKIFLKISKWIYNSADSILVTSEMFKEYFKEVLKIDDKNIDSLPQYAEDLFENCKENLDENLFNFVFAGNIGDLQSVETIILAANELKQNKNIVFHIVGDGSKLKECKGLSKKLKLSNLKFYGRRPVEEMLYFYGMANAMLLTLKADKTISYTLPGKVQSYMISKKAILGAIDGEAMNVIKRSECGLCCPAEDYKGFAKIILEFCNNKNNGEMAEKSYKYYLENFTKDSFMNKLEKKLEELNV